MLTPSAAVNKQSFIYFTLFEGVSNEMLLVSISLSFSYRPSKVKDLPDSVCPTLLDKIEEADLSSLPQRSLSRPAFTERALRCLANVHTRIQTT